MADGLSVATIRAIPARSSQPFPAPAQMSPIHPIALVPIQMVAECPLATMVMVNGWSSVGNGRCSHQTSVRHARSCTALKSKMAIQPSSDQCVFCSATNGAASNTKATNNENALRGILIGFKHVAVLKGLGNGLLLSRPSLHQAAQSPASMLSSDSQSQAFPRSDTEKSMAVFQAFFKLLSTHKIFKFGARSRHQDVPQGTVTLEKLAIEQALGLFLRSRRASQSGLYDCWLPAHCKFRRHFYGVSIGQDPTVPLRFRTQCRSRNGGQDMSTPLPAKNGLRMVDCQSKSISNTTPGPTQAHNGQQQPSNRLSAFTTVT